MPGHGDAEGWGGGRAGWWARSASAGRRPSPAGSRARRASRGSRAPTRRRRCARTARRSASCAGRSGSRGRRSRRSRRSARSAAGRRARACRAGPGRSSAEVQVDRARRRQLDDPPRVGEGGDEDAAVREQLRVGGVGDRRAHRPDQAAVRGRGGRSSRRSRSRAGRRRAAACRRSGSRSRRGGSWAQLRRGSATTVPRRGELDDPAVADVGDGDVAVREQVGVVRGVQVAGRGARDAGVAVASRSVRGARSETSVRVSLNSSFVIIERQPGAKNASSGPRRAAVAPDDLLLRRDDQRAVVVAVGDQEVAGERAGRHGGEAERRPRRVGARGLGGACAWRDVCAGGAVARGREAEPQPARNAAAAITTPGRARRVTLVSPDPDGASVNATRGVPADTWRLRSRRRPRRRARERPAGRDGRPALTAEIGQCMAQRAQRVREHVDRHRAEPDDEARLVQAEHARRAGPIASSAHAAAEERQRRERRARARRARASAAPAGPAATYSGPPA